VSIFNTDGHEVIVYEVISAVLLLAIAYSALLLAIYWMLGNREVKSLNLRKSIQLVIFSYMLFVEGFAYIYLLVSRHTAFAFAKGTQHDLSFGEAIYFSITTLTTVGFGDIVPKSAEAKLIVCGEIVVGVVFGIFAFSLVVSAIVKSGLAASRS